MTKHVMCPAPPGALELFLQPGEFFFGTGETRIRTLLGSCVAIVLWHPGKRIGGMCHYLLPSRGPVAEGTLDGRYADEALGMFLQELRRSQTVPAEYMAKVFGGGVMLGGTGRSASSVASGNVQAARSLLAGHGFSVTAEDLGGRGHRNVILDLWSGDVWVRHVALRAPADHTAGAFA